MPQLSRTIAALRENYDSGATKSLEWRIAHLSALQRLLQEEQEEILAVLAADLGKSTFEAYTSEIALVVADIENTRAHLKNWMKAEKVPLPFIAGVGAAAKVVHEPLGVALIIGAWNYPIMLALGPLVGALAAGNVAVVKPSELAPRSADFIEKAVARYFDPSSVAVVQGGVRETTQLLKQRFDKIFFTGSPPVGRIVMTAAAKHLTPVVLELGGKSPAIVCKDANLEVAATRIAWGKFFNAGQTCVGVDYALVHASLYEEFIDKICESIYTFYGNDPRSSPDLARIVNLPNLERLAGLLSDQTVAHGGQVVSDDLYMAPTVLRDVDPDSPVMQEEIFGPILPVLPFQKVNEAIEFINAHEKPLAAYVFSQDKATQSKILSRVSSGGACVNDTLTQLAVGDAPFGGVGMSGMGAYHGYDGYLAFTHRRTVLTRVTAFDPSMRYPPYSPTKTKITSMIL